MSIIGFRKVPEKAPEYLDLRSQPAVCPASGMIGVQAHHRIGGGFRSAR